MEYLNGRRSVTPERKTRYRTLRRRKIIRARRKFEKTDAEVQKRAEYVALMRKIGVLPQE